MRAEMAASYRSIHYSMRPAKNVERKLIVETMRRLERLTPVSAMRYVGMGSLYFADFSLFHRRLGIEEMHSIENATVEGTKERFRANAPYGTQLHFNHTSQALPNLPWDRPALVWLDYDGKLTGEVLTDLEIVVAKCIAPTLIIVSVNVDPGLPEGRFSQFVENVSEELLPDNVRTDSDLAGWRMADASRTVMSVLMNDILSNRNGVLEDQLLAPQIFNLRYRDGAKMLTLGWLVYAQSLQVDVDACDLWALPFINAGDEGYEITVPMLTLRETLLLDAQMPSGTAAVPGIPKSDVEAYMRLYRYLPSFVDADV
jgi:hypothetical protein